MINIKKLKILGKALMEMFLKRGKNMVKNK